MKALIIEKPQTFDRVDRVKEAVGEEALVGDERLWILGGPLVVRLDVGALVTAPRGFVTDGASVPYVAQLISGWRPWDEPHRWGAIVHDWLYCRTAPPSSKAFSDLAFRAVLRAAGTSAFRAEVMYRAVQIFGGPAYRWDQKIGPTIRN